MQAQNEVPPVGPIYIYTGKKKRKQKGVSYYTQQRNKQINPKSQYDRNATNNTMHNIK